MKSGLLIMLLTLPLWGISQELAKEEVANLYIEALKKFESTPLRIHELDSKILVNKPDCENRDLPSNIGNSVVEWFCFDDDLPQQLEGKPEKHNGRSVILISHRQPGSDTVTVRVDQWTVDNIGSGTSFMPVNKDMHPEYKKKDHDFVFIKVDSKWELIEKANNLNPPSEKAKEIEEIFQKGNSLSQEGKYKEALEYVERSMAMDSSLYQRYYFRAELKENLGLYESAISDISRCIVRCKCTYREFHISNYLLKRASLHQQNNEVAMAMADLNESIISNPENWESYLERGILLGKSQKFEQALDDLNKSIQLNETFLETYIVRGLVQAKLGKMEDACSDFQIAKDGGYAEAKEWMKINCR